MERSGPAGVVIRRLGADDAVFGAFTARGELVGVAGLRTGAGVQERHKAKLFGCGFVEWGREPDAVRVDGQAITKVHMSCVLYR